MIKIIVFIYCIILPGLICSEQKPNKIDDLINISIESYISLKELNITDGFLSKDYLDKIVFLKDNFSSEFDFSNSIREKYEIHFFDEKTYKKSDLRNGVHLFRLMPSTLNGDTFSVVIGGVFVKMKCKNIKIKNNDFITFEYKYNCHINEWTLSNSFNSSSP